MVSEPIYNAGFFSIALDGTFASQDNGQPTEAITHQLLPLYVQDPDREQV